MSGRHFIDTNIFVYCFDDSALEKQTKAKEIIRGACVVGDGVISSQVVQEFLNVATNKFTRQMTTSDASQYLHQILMPLCHAFPSTALYDKALMLKDRHQLGFYDCLIVSAALELGCSRLLSEDLHSGLTIDRMVIENPFVDIL